MNKLKFHLIILSLFFSFGCNPALQKAFVTPEEVIYRKGELSLQNVSRICNDPANYIPDTSDVLTMQKRQVRINIHFMNTPDSTVNFREEEGRIYARDIIYNTNRRLSHLQPLNLPVGNVLPVINPLIEFVLAPDPEIPGDDGIYFHYNDDDWFVDKNDPQNTVFSTRQYNKYGRQKGEVINVFFMEHPTDSLNSETFAAPNWGVGAGNWAKMVNSFHAGRTPYWTNPETGVTHNHGAWYMAGLMLHELLHCLGLSHTWTGNDGCWDTPAHPNCWNRTETSPCDTMWSNNIMDYNDIKDALSPCQVGKARQSLANPRAVARNMVVQDWCEYDPDQDIEIMDWGTTEWKGHRDVSGNITIHYGSTLRIFCTVNMPENGKIIVRPGGRLILNGAVITNSCGSKWQGIEVWQNRKSRGEVVFENDARIENSLSELNAEFSP